MLEALAITIILLGSVWLQRVIYSHRMFLGLFYSCDFSKHEAYEGDEIALVEIVHNKKLLPLPWLKAQIYTSKWLEYAGMSSTIAQELRYVSSSFFLKSYQKTTRIWKLKCLKRGVFDIHSVTLSGSDILGLGTESIPVETGAKLTVYPAIVDIDNLFLDKKRLQGDMIVNRWIVDDPFTFAGAREYAPGDPMNRVHWLATAREGKLMVRKHEYTDQPDMAVLLNIQSMEHEYDQVVEKEKVELGIKVAATIIERSVASAIPVRLATNGALPNWQYLSLDEKCIFTSQGTGREHVAYLLELLASVELRQSDYFELFMHRLVDRDLRNTAIYLITSYLNHDIYTSIRQLKQKGCTVKVFVLSHIENGQLPDDIDARYLI